MRNEVTCEMNDTAWMQYLCWLIPDKIFGEILDIFEYLETFHFIEELENKKKQAARFGVEQALQYNFQYLV